MKERSQLHVYFGNSKRDRIVATWLDNISEDPDINVSDLIKAYLYQVATGTNSKQDVSDIIAAIKAEFAKLPSMLAMQDGIVNTGYTVTNDDIEEIARRLGSMPD
jgi:hypothetical protein